MFLHPRQIAIALFLLPFVAQAQQAPIATIPPGEDRITAVEKGKLVPYTGQLFDVDTAIRWAFWLQQYKFRLEEDVKTEKKYCAVQIEHREGLLEVEKERNAQVEKDLRQRLLQSEQARLQAEEEARNPPWYDTMEFGVIVGTVATAAVIAVAAWSLGESK